MARIDTTAVQLRAVWLANEAVGHDDAASQRLLNRVGTSSSGRPAGVVSSLVPPVQQNAR